MLEVRVRQLASPRVRWTLAHTVTVLLYEAETPPRLSRLALSVSRQAVLGARDELLELADALTDPACSDVHGIAMASRLLCDGLSPLYNRESTWRLRAATRQAVAALRGDT